MNPSISFEQDSRLVDQLLVLLNKEQANLINADIDAIEGIIDEKAQLLQSISVTVQNRYDALSKNGFEGNEQGMAAWLTGQKEPAIHQSWLKFQKMLDQAKELNRINGMLINKHFNRNQQFIDALNSAHSPGQMYGANGQATTQSFMRGSLRV